MLGLILAISFWFQIIRIDEHGCPCDPARPETMEARQCSLCREAEKRPAGEEFFFLRDANPRKPNRWLILTRKHYDGTGALQQMPRAERIRLWEAAIRKARELWGDEWGLAYNGDKVRTQCHMHIHIGKFIKAADNDRKVVLVRGPAEIPVPKDGTGLWIHPQGAKLRVHLGEQICETALHR